MHFLDLQILIPKGKDFPKHNNRISALRLHIPAFPVQGHVSPGEADQAPNTDYVITMSSQWGDG